MTAAQAPAKRPPFFYVNHWGNGDVDVSIFRPRGADDCPHRVYRPTRASIKRLHYLLGDFQCKPFYHGLTDVHMGLGVRWKSEGRQP